MKVSWGVLPVALNIYYVTTHFQSLPCLWARNLSCVRLATIVFALGTISVSRALLSSRARLWTPCRCRTSSSWCHGDSSRQPQKAQPCCSRSRQHQGTSGPPSLQRLTSMSEFHPSYSTIRTPQVQYRTPNGCRLVKSSSNQSSHAHYASREYLRMCCANPCWPWGSHH